MVEHRARYSKDVGSYPTLGKVNFFVFELLACGRVLYALNVFGFTFPIHFIRDHVQLMPIYASDQKRRLGVGGYLAVGRFLF